MRRQAFFSILILSAAILVAVIMVRSRPTIEPEPIAETAPLVETLTLLSTTAPLEILATGTVFARDRVNIAAQVGGRVTYVHPDFVEGGRITKGETLIRLDRADFKNQVLSAQADLAAQKVGVLQAEQDVEIARAELSQFDARFSRTSAKTDSSTATGFRPPANLSNAQTKDTSRSVEMKNPERLLATREPQLQSAIAARDRAEAGLSNAELALERTTVSAPFSGLVQSEAVAVGSIISAGQSLGEIVSSDIFEIRVSLSDDDAALIPGLFAIDDTPVPARVRQILAGQVIEWPANISRVSSVRDSQTRRIDIFLRVENPLTSGQVMGDLSDRTAPPLFIGSLVDVVLSGSPGKPYALINTDFLRSDNLIWLAENEKLKNVQATLITRTDDLAAISFPSLQSRQTLITSDLRAPVEGMALRVTGAE